MVMKSVILKADVVDKGASVHVAALYDGANGITLKLELTLIVSILKELLLHFRLIGIIFSLLVGGDDVKGCFVDYSIIILSKVVKTAVS